MQMKEKIVHGGCGGYSCCYLGCVENTGQERNC